MIVECAIRALAKDAKRRMHALRAAAPLELRSQPGSLAAQYFEASRTA